MNQDKYLGDGVYASFDGYQIWLVVNHHENKVIALDPHVQEALIDYIENLHRELEAAAQHKGDSE